ncbi:hypothetical protein KGY79_03020 [Candidatus Bipolaricaulota bacterium]|nr:hypothetical protein [Candidatus Bipolaricaulota bacterium]
MVDDLFRLLLDHLSSEGSYTIIVSGPVGSGKTRLIKKVVARLKREDKEPGGVLSPRLMNSGETVGYDVVNLTTGDRRSFVRSNPPGRKVGRFFLKPDGLKFANRAVSEAAGVRDPVFVDEVGRLELEDNGLAPSVKELLSSRSQAVLLVRDEFVPEAREVFEISEYDEIKVG